MFKNIDYSSTSKNTGDTNWCLISSIQPAHTRKTLFKTHKLLMKIEINLYYGYGTTFLTTFATLWLQTEHIPVKRFNSFSYLLRCVNTMCLSAERDIAVFILTVGTVYQRVFFHRLLLCIRGKQEMIEHILASQDSGKTP